MSVQLNITKITEVHICGSTREKGPSRGIFSTGFGNQGASEFGWDIIVQFFIKFKNVEKMGFAPYAAIVKVVLSSNINISKSSTMRY